MSEQPARAAEGDAGTSLERRAADCESVWAGTDDEAGSSLYLARSIALPEGWA